MGNIQDQPVGAFWNVLDGKPELERHIGKEGEIKGLCLIFPLHVQSWPTCPIYVRWL